MLYFSMPVLGETFIARPELVFINLWVIGAVILGLSLPFWRRNRLDAWFSTGSVIVLLLIMFMPGISPLFTRIVSARIMLTFVILLPLGIIYGSVLDSLLNLVARFSPWLIGLGYSLLAFTVIILVFEPFPIPASARDQLRAVNQTQATRNWLAADQALQVTLNTALYIESGDSVYLAPERSANFVAEAVPGALITSGRSNGNSAHSGSIRFYNRPDWQPFLDTDDLSFISTWGVRFIVMRENDSRVMQLRQDDRFILQSRADGYLVFEVLNANSRLEDDYFAQMNAVFRQLEAPQRWENGLHLARSGDDSWLEMAAEWASLLDSDADNELARVGLACSLLLAGDDEAALPQWEARYDALPDDALTFQIYAHMLRNLNMQDEILGLIDTGLSSSDAGMRAVAAATALDEQFIYMLDDDTLLRVLEAVENSTAAWELLAVHDQWDAVRARSALVASRGDFATASAWLGSLTMPEIRPEDLSFQAMLLLAQGDVDGAMALLAPYRDPDYIITGKALHTERWEPNTVAGIYALLAADRELKDGDLQHAVGLYQQAAEQGYVIAARTGLVRVYTQLDDISAARSVLDMMLTSTDSAERFWGTVAHLELALAQGEDTQSTLAALNEYLGESGHPAVTLENVPRLLSWLEMPPKIQTEIVEVTTLDDQVWISGVFGPGSASYPVQTWMLSVFDPVSYTPYGEAAYSAFSVPGALIAWNLPVSIANTPPFTPAIAMVSGSNSIMHYEADNAPLTLYPVAAATDAITAPLDYQLADSIQLTGYDLGELTSGSLTLTLFWRALGDVANDYQVLVHVVNEDGEIVSQLDSAPLNGNYPTSRWAVDMLVADERSMEFQTPLAPGTYTIRVGMYNLSDLTRLVVTPADNFVLDDTVALGPFIIQD
jgi:hypothetical protein